MPDGRKLAANIQQTNQREQLKQLVVENSVGVALAGSVNYWQDLREFIQRLVLKQYHLRMRI